MLMFIFLPFASVLMIHHVTICETIVDMDAGFFGSNKMAIAPESSSVTMKEVSQIAEKENKSIAIYQDCANFDNVRTIYFTKNYVNMPMIEGRFFDKSDLKSGNYCAVIGKNLKNSVIKKNGKSYIEVGGNYFNVLGIIGLESSTPYDSKILINGLANPSKYYDILYTLDCFDKNSDVYTSNIIKNIEKTYKTSVKTISAANTTLSRLVPRVLYSRWFVVILICDLLCILLLSMEWGKQKQQEMCIKRLLGCSDSKIRLEICLKYNALTLTSGIFSVLLLTIIYSSYSKFLWFGIACYIPCAVIFTFFMIKSLLKTSIAEAIK